VNTSDCHSIYREQCTTLSPLSDCTSRMNAADNKKRYILFAKDDGRADSEKPCAFFASAAGCRNGANCKFSHDANPVVLTHTSSKIENGASSKLEKKEKKEKKEKRKDTSMTPSINVTSGVSDLKVLELERKLMEQQKILEAQIALNQQYSANARVENPTGSDSREKKRKHKTVPQPTAVGNEVVPNKSFKTNMNTAPVHNYESGGCDDDNDEEDDNDLIFGAVNRVINSEGLHPLTPYNPPPEKPPTSTQASIAAAPSIANSLFVGSEDTLRALQSSGSKHALYGANSNSASKKKNMFAAAPTAKVGQISASNPITSAVAVPPAPPLRSGTAAKIPFNPSGVDFASLPWQSLVALTHAHSRYMREYKSLNEDHTWVRARPCNGEQQATQAQVLCLDCEMCETSDPVTGEIFDNALIRVSVVDGLNPDKVLLDSLVAPGLPVTDMRTNIHGITEEQLVGTTFTLRHVQAALLKLCSDRTVIVGHSLHRDLSALRFAHSLVVDTAYLYTVHQQDNASPSLRDVSEQVLHWKLADTHDSIQDARASLYAAAKRLIAGPQAPIVRSGGGSGSGSGSGSSHKGTGTSATDDLATSLFIHRIPEYCTEEHLAEMLTSYTQIVPVKVNPITRPVVRDPKVPAGKTLVFFKTPTHSELAFESISGPNRPDKQNRSQKRVYFKGGGYICVRK